MQIEFSQHQYNLAFWGEVHVLWMVLETSEERGGGCCNLERGSLKICVYGSGSESSWADVMACCCQKGED